MPGFEAQMVGECCAKGSGLGARAKLAAKIEVLTQGYSLAEMLQNSQRMGSARAFLLA